MSGRRFILGEPMDVDELLTRAWNAVEKSAVPEPLQAIALKEAIDFLRADGSSSPDGSADGRGDTADQSQRKPAAGRSSSPSASGNTGDTPRSADEFFAHLASESGESERDLRDILTVTADSIVHVTQPTKDLGDSVAEQAKNVTALVASARAIGLGENPVNAAAVRKELDRKRCYDNGNFAAKHLGRLKGFNAGATRNEIVLTSKWTGEFSAAVAKAHGRPATPETK
jgi:hypothetical protein